MTLSATSPCTRQRGLVLSPTMERWLQDSAGSSLLEFAIAILVVMTVIVGIINGALALYANHYAANAALEGARYAMVRGAGWAGAACTTTTTTSCTATADSVKKYLLATAPNGIKAAKTTVTTTWPGTTAAGSACYTASGANATGCAVKVTVTYSFNLGLPLVPKNTLLFTGTSTMPITQ